MEDTSAVLTHTHKKILFARVRQHREQCVREQRGERIQVRGRRRARRRWGAGKPQQANINAPRAFPESFPEVPATAASWLPLERKDELLLLLHAE